MALPKQRQRAATFFSAAPESSASDASASNFLTAASLGAALRVLGEVTKLESSPLVHLATVSERAGARAAAGAPCGHP